MTAHGAACFARFAYPPNALGYCGPPGARAVLRQRDTEAEIRSLACRFEGAWPYLELIAEHAGIDDPLDQRVVDAYWLGGGPAAAVAPAHFAVGLRDRIGDRLGVPWEQVAAAIAAGGRPTHAFHVFSASPWVGLLARGLVAEPLRVLDRCRVAWGEVLAVEGDHARVLGRPLVWQDGIVTLGATEDRQLRVSDGGSAPDDVPSPGDCVAVHWGWVCDRLTPDRLERLRTSTHQELELVQRRLREVAGP